MSGEGGKNVDQGLCDVPEAGEPGINRAKVEATEGRWDEVGSSLHTHPLGVVQGNRELRELPPLPFCLPAFS